MHVTALLKKILLKYFVDMHWSTLVLVLFFYMATSWLALYLSNETELIGSSFPYWLIVTASTVGYGDLSPSTLAGKYVTTLFVIPFGLSLFAVAVGRIAAYAAFIWRKGIMGLKPLDIEGHILVLGCHDKRTIRLVRLLLKEESLHTIQRPIVLCVADEMENPFPREIQFVKVDSFSDDNGMNHACVFKAACIVIANATDEESMTSALYCNGVNHVAHTIVYFDNEKLTSILKKHCPSIEVTPSVSVEMMAKAAVDRGSSVLHQRLLNASDGMTQFSAVLPSNCKPIAIKSLFVDFKQRYDATLIATATVEGADTLKLNPALDSMVSEGSTIYYIAKNRIHHIDWEAFGV